MTEVTQTRGVKKALTFLFQKNIRTKPLVQSTNQWSDVHLLHHERAPYSAGALKHSAILCIIMMHKLPANNGFVRDFLFVVELVESSLVMKQWKTEMELFSSSLAHIRPRPKGVWWISSLRHLHDKMQFMNRGFCFCSVNFYDVGNDTKLTCNSILSSTLRNRNNGSAKVPFDSINNFVIRFNVLHKQFSLEL